MLYVGDVAAKKGFCTFYFYNFLNFFLSLHGIYWFGQQLHVVANSVCGCSNFAIAHSVHK